MNLANVAYVASPEISNHELNGLIAASWSIVAWQRVAGYS